MKPAFPLFLLSALAVQGADKVQARLLRASVISGAGREPLGALPPPRLRATLEITGLPPKAKPRFKVWIVNSRTLPALEAGANPAGRRIHGAALVCPVTQVEGSYSVQGTWKGPVDPDLRVVVEVFLGRRRLALAAAPVEEHLLPSAKPSGGKEEQ